jgi:cytidyltransferase-like protein
MLRTFVSGCYDILHAGHVEFFTQARSLGDHLTVCFASANVLWEHKHRKSSLPDDHKKALIESLRMVDEVVISDGKRVGLDFEDHFRRLRPNILAVTQDDQYEDIKRALCDEIGAVYRRLPKTPPKFEPISTTQIVRYIHAPTEVPLRVDFGGGWLDVPRKARDGAYIVNCAISPMVSLRDWPYEKHAGLGGSGAWALLNGRQGVDSELELGVGWQDPAVIRETGACVWHSGPRPQLAFKRRGAFLNRRMALLWTGSDHDTPGVVDNSRDYDLIEKAGLIAKQAVLEKDVVQLGEAILTSYAVQMGEGMHPLPEAEGSVGQKYVGGGWGGYALYLFTNPEARDAYVTAKPDIRRPIEPYLRAP